MIYEPATEEQALESFATYLEYHWGRRGPMNPDQVRDTARGLTQVYEELVGHKLTANYTDRVKHELRPAVGNRVDDFETFAAAWDNVRAAINKVECALPMQMTAAAKELMEARQAMEETIRAMSRQIAAKKS